MKFRIVNVLAFFAAALAIFVLSLFLRDAGNAPVSLAQAFNDPTVGTAGLILFMLAAGVVAALWAHDPLYQSKVFEL